MVRGAAECRRPETRLFRIIINHNMETYRLLQDQSGNWHIENMSPMYPKSFEDEINRLAGEKITGRGLPAMPGLLGGFTNSFRILADRRGAFKEKLLPYIGSRREGNALFIWDRREGAEANQI